MPSRIDTEIDKTIVKFQFLCDIPTTEISPLFDQDDCTICKEPYRNDAWELGGTVHRPARLPCGHMIVFQCLARYMLAPTFPNRCPLCRAQIINMPAATKRLLSPTLTPSFARLEVLAVIARGGGGPCISRMQKRQLLERFEKDLWGEKGGLGVQEEENEESDRIMGVWEEFLDSMCAESALGPEDRNQGLDGRAAVGAARMNGRGRRGLFAPQMDPRFEGYGPVPRIFRIAHWSYVVASVLAFIFVAYTLLF